MIYLRLFLNFLMIGALSFGGGYGMVSLVRERVLSNGWLTENEFLNFIAVSESTPGPLAVNMATFIGSTQGGILGSFVATLGVVLPSFSFDTFSNFVPNLEIIVSSMQRNTGCDLSCSGIRCSAILAVTFINLE